MKALVRKSGLFAIAFVIANLFFAGNAVGQTTRTWVPTTGGAWTTAGNWSPSGIPVNNDNVIINSNQSAIITAVPANLSLANMTISGNCNLTSTVQPTLTITGSFSVAAGVTVTFGTSGSSNDRINITLSSTSISSILGTVNSNTRGTAVLFTSSGDLTIGSAGLITSTGGQGNSNFTLSATGTLRIGSTAGITSTGGTTGNIRVDGARSYSTAAKYDYNGTAGDQATGNGLPNTVGSLAISNTTGIVTLPSAKTITSNLSIGTGAILNLGTFTHTAGTLTLGGQGTVNGSWGSTTSAATNKNNTFFAATTGIVNVTTSTCTPPAAPTVSTPVKYCVGASVSPLTATGTSLLWYSTLTGPPAGTATAPTPSTASAGNTSYFVSQTVGCEGPRAEIVVTINSNPTSTVNGSTNITCFGAADGTITILANGGTGPYSYSVDDGLTWLPSATNPFVYPGLSANVPYKVKVQDLNGCQSQTF